MNRRALLTGIGTKKLPLLPYVPWKVDEKSQAPIYPRTPLGKPPLLSPQAPWGLAVYRTDYSDDAAWRRMQAELERHAAEALGRSRRAGLLLRHHMAFMDEDRAVLDGAWRGHVREMFTLWAAEELRGNWNPTEDSPKPDLISARGTDFRSPGYRAGARYNFCLMVDADDLISLDSETPTVKILRKDYNREWEASSLSSPTAAGVDKGRDAYRLPLSSYVGACRILLDPDNWYSKDE
ncbi:hypothetical protein PG996_007267 [Apiospora saccharicola]|uniref:Uncharacterized protein n=1 Tax=Apiospora saccharicola TaxID=335842 RepID=A0ABR1VAB6_9PEZI